MTIQSLRIPTAQLLDRLIFFALLALIVLTAVPYGAVEPLWQAVFICIVFGLGVLWVIEGMVSGTWRLTALPLLLPLLALTVLAFFQTLPLWHSDILLPGAGARQPLSADPYETWFFAIRLLALMVVLELLTRYTSSRHRLHILIIVVIIVGVLCALFGITRQFMQVQQRGFILPALPRGVGYGQFYNRSHFAFLMEMVFGLIAGFVAGGGVQRARISIYLVAMLTVWMALVLSTSRGGVLSMLCQLIFIGVMLSVLRSWQMKSKQVIGFENWFWRISDLPLVRVLLIICLIGAIVFSVLLVGGDPLVSRFEASLADEQNQSNVDTRQNTDRKDIWKATLKMVKAHPIAGVGFGGYWADVAEYHDASGVFVPQEAHNDYLELLASGGVFGLAFGIWFLVVLIRQARVRLREADTFRRAACLGALAGLSGVAVHSFVDFGLHITINALLCIALVVIATVNHPANEVNPRIVKMA